MKAIKTTEVVDKSMTKEEMVDFLLNNDVWFIESHIIAIYKSVLGYICCGVFSCIYMDGLYFLDSNQKFGIRVSNYDDYGKELQKCMEYALTKTTNNA